MLINEQLTTATCALNSFLFSLTKNTKHKCINKTHEIYCSSSYLNFFGAGYDIIIYDNCN